MDHLDSLSRRGFCFVSPTAVARYLVDQTPLPRRAVLLTFDDCYSDLLGVAREVLQSRHIEALAFAVTDVKSAGSKVSVAPAPVMTSVKDGRMTSRLVM